MKEFHSKNSSQDKNHLSLIWKFLYSYKNSIQGKKHFGMLLMDDAETRKDIVTQTF